MVSVANYDVDIVFIELVDCLDGGCKDRRVHLRAHDVKATFHALQTPHRYGIDDVEFAHQFGSCLPSNVYLLGLRHFSLPDLLKYVFEVLEGVDLKPGALGLFSVGLINACKLLFHFLLIEKMESSFLDLFARKFVGDGPGLDVLVFFIESVIEMPFDCGNNFLRIVRLIDIEIFNVIGNSVNFLLRSGFNLIFIILFLKYAIDINIDLVAIFLSFLFGEGTSPIEIFLGHDDIMKLIIVVVIFEKFFGIFE
jgi:hypothetical protein